MFWLFIVLANAANPECRNMCDDPICAAICEPDCKPPQCSYECVGSGVTCQTPRCHTVCPPTSETSPSDSCPTCETRCDPLVCNQPLHQCQIVCEAPQCSNLCRPPPRSLCPLPTCVIQCEKPACESDRVVSSAFSNTINNSIVVIFALWVVWELNIL